MIILSRSFSLQLSDFLSFLFVLLQTILEISFFFASCVSFQRSFDTIVSLKSTMFRACFSYGLAAGEYGFMKASERERNSVSLR